MADEVSIWLDAQWYIAQFSFGQTRIVYARNDALLMMMLMMLMMLFPVHHYRGYYRDGWTSFQMAFINEWELVRWNVLILLDYRMVRGNYWRNFNNCRRSMDNCSTNGGKIVRILYSPIIFDSNLLFRNSHSYDKIWNIAEIKFIGDHW